MPPDAESTREDLEGHALGRLTTEVAHDLNNTLNVIMGRAQLAMMDVPAGTPLHEDLEEIERGARASAEFTRRLLLYAREQMRRNPPPEVGSVVAEVTRMLQETLRPPGA